MLKDVATIDRQIHSVYIVSGNRLDKTNKAHFNDLAEGIHRFLDPTIPVRRMDSAKDFS